MPKISINGHQIERVYKKEVLDIVIDLAGAGKMKNNATRYQKILIF
jgi:hypothetical protein